MTLTQSDVKVLTAQIREAAASLARKCEAHGELMVDNLSQIIGATHDLERDFPTADAQEAAQPLRVTATEVYDYQIKHDGNIVYSGPTEGMSQDIIKALCHAAPQPESEGDARELAQNVVECCGSFYGFKSDEATAIIQQFAARIHAETLEECAKLCERIPLTADDAPMLHAAAREIRQLGKRDA